MLGEEDMEEETEERKGEGRRAEERKGGEKREQGRREPRHIPHKSARIRELVRGKASLGKEGTGLAHKPGKNIKETTVSERRRKQ